MRRGAGARSARMRQAPAAASNQVKLPASRSAEFVEAMLQPRALPI